MKSTDGGANWEAKSKIGGGNKVILDNILSMAISPSDSNVIYVGTEKDGFFVSKDGSESWEKINVPVKKIYSIAPTTDGVVYVCGVFNKKGKIYKVTDQEKEWKEIYSEPSSKSLVTTMFADGSVIYAGTSEGMIFKSVDGGENWTNLYQSNGAVYDIEVRGELVVALILGQDVLISRDYGETFESVRDNSGSEDSVKIGSPFSVDVSYGSESEIYIGTNKGLFLLNEFDGYSFKINTLNAKSTQPIRSVAVSPYNSDRIIYSVGHGMYMSEDGGSSWKVFDVNRATGASRIIFDQGNLDIVYATFRNFK